MNKLIHISILLLNGWFSYSQTQEDTLYSLKDKYEISILGSKYIGQSYMTKSSNVLASSQESSYMGLNCRIGLIHRHRFNTKLSIGVDLWSLKQNVAYTYFVTNVTSTHTPQLRTMVLNVAAQFNYKVVDRGNRSFGFDILPGVDINLLNSSKLSIVYSDYADPSLGFEIGRFALNNDSKVYPSLLIQLWSMIYVGDFSIKPFFGMKFTNSQTLLTLEYINGDMRSFHAEGLKSFLNLGAAVVF